MGKSQWTVSVFLLFLMNALLYCKRSLKLIQKILTEFRWYGSIYSSSTPHHLLFHLISDFLGTLYRSSLHPVVMLKPFPYSLENLAIQCGNNSQGNTSPVEMGHWNLPSLCSAIISLQINMDRLALLTWAVTDTHSP